MDELDNILASMAVLANEVKTAYKPHTLDSNLNVISPIDEMINNFKKFKQYLLVAHMNAVSVPLHKDQIQSLLVKTGIDILGMSETNIKYDVPFIKLNKC